MSQATAKRYDPLREAQEIQEKLSSHNRKLGFFLGAGTSMAVGLDGIRKLTENVGNSLEGPSRDIYQRLRTELGEKATVETILNRIRLYKELLVGSHGKTLDGLTQETVLALEAGVCQGIYQRLVIDPPKGLRPQTVFARWLRAARREFPVEVFTTNYDLLFERALEGQRVPFFDGFVGATAPFFAPESVEADGSQRTADVLPPKAWVRLWKVHGSISWRAMEDAVMKTRNIVRAFAGQTFTGNELVIYPSREKYMDSRKLPFITYLDRLGRFTSEGETLLVISGYSFGDEHLNDILFQGLRANQRLHVIAFAFDKLTDDVASYGEQFHNLSIYAADAACVGGIRGEWLPPTRKRAPDENWPFWNETDNLFTLGDFIHFGDFLEMTMGLATSTTQELPASPINEPSKAEAPENERVG